MHAADQFPNIEQVGPSRQRLQGWTKLGRVFRIGFTPFGASGPHWYAKALTQRPDVVLEIRGPTLASISNQLAAIE